ncbi:MAG: hypothetical protein ABIS03_13815 [Gemmatimonadaceae bacterium]
MSAPFVTGIRTTDDVIRLDGDDSLMLHLRVQAAELWSTIRVDAPASASVETVKRASLERFYPDGAGLAEFVVKVRGFEILDEGATLAAAGVRDGSTLLIGYRRRTPVK